jgi:hypothetical protein
VYSYFPFSFRLLLLALLLHGGLVPLRAGSPMRTQISRLQKESPDSAERMEIVRLPIFLDRANFRPGKIDGLGGEFTQKAADRNCRANNLLEGTPLDVSGIRAPFREYTVKDLKWIGPQASKPPEQEKLKAMLYANLWQLVAERFHCDLNFPHKLNPRLPEDKVGVGTVFRVPNVKEFQMVEVTALEKRLRDEEKNKKTGAEAQAAATPAQSSSPLLRRLELLRAERLIEVYEGDRLVACFPCTPGSRQIPVPSGTWKVTANVLMPTFRWDKSVLESGVRSDTAYRDTAYQLPPGPRNPGRHRVDWPQPAKRWHAWNAYARSDR